MNLSNLLKIGLLSISTLITGCKSNSKSEYLDINFNDPSINLRVVLNEPSKENV